MNTFMVMARRFLEAHIGLLTKAINLSIATLNWYVPEKWKGNIKTLQYVIGN